MLIRQFRHHAAVLDIALQQMDRLLRKKQQLRILPTEKRLKPIPQSLEIYGEGFVLMPHTAGGI